MVRFLSVAKNIGRYWSEFDVLFSFEAFYLDWFGFRLFSNLSHLFLKARGVAASSIYIVCCFSYKALLFSIYMSFFIHCLSIYLLSFFLFPLPPPLSLSLFLSLYLSLSLSLSPSIKKNKYLRIIKV